MMDPVFDRLRSGAPVDMRSKEYQAAIAELQRADRVLFHLNHTEPRTKEWLDLRQELFQGTLPDGVNFLTPVQIDFPMQMRFEGS